MPASTVEKVPVGYMNRKINVAGDRTYDDWTITVYNDDAHTTRDAIRSMVKHAAWYG
ncbi:tail tube monomer [Klebsiella phage CPRSA]|nr:tail tube monomer [Klebsiella phage CPRSA]